MTEPGYAMVIAPGREPELPVEPRLVRRDEPRAPPHFTGFPPELVRLPGDPVVASFDDDLRPLGRHDGKQAVAVDQMKRFQPFDEPFERFRPLSHEAKQTTKDFHGQKRDDERDGDSYPERPAA